MKNNLFAFLFLISNFVFAQKEVKFSPFDLHMSYHAPYLANDGSFAIFENNSIVGRHQIHMFDKYGNVVTNYKYKAKSEYKPFFDPKNKCFIRWQFNGKEIHFIQISFDGTVLEKEVQYKNENKEYYLHHTTINQSGNIEIYMNGTGWSKSKMICIEYNAVNQNVKVQDFNMFQGDGFNTPVYIGKRDNETYFVNSSRGAADDVLATVFSVNAKNEMRVVGDFKFPKKETLTLFYGAERIDPYIKSKYNDEIMFKFDFKTFEAGKVPNVVQYGESGVPTYTIYKLEENDQFSVIEFDPKKHRDLSGTYKLQYDIQDEDEDGTALVLVEKNLSLAVLYSDFETPLHELEIEHFSAMPVPELAFRKAEFGKLYHAAENCLYGAFAVCDDGIARLVTMDRIGNFLLYEMSVAQ